MFDIREMDDEQLGVVVCVLWEAVAATMNDAERLEQKAK
jgi:hypothetical protein